MKVPAKSLTYSLQIKIKGPSKMFQVKFPAKSFKKEFDVFKEFQQNSFKSKGSDSEYHKVPSERLKSSFQVQNCWGFHMGWFSKLCYLWKRLCHLTGVFWGVDYCSWHLLILLGLCALICIGSTRDPHLGLFHFLYQPVGCVRNLLALLD